MEEYRAYVIGPDGHIINRVDIRCPDVKEARRLARIAVDGHAVESIKAAPLARAFRFECRLLALSVVPLRCGI